MSLSPKPNNAKRIIKTEATNHIITCFKLFFVITIFLTKMAAPAKIRKILAILLPRIFPSAMSL